MKKILCLMILLLTMCGFSACEKAEDARVALAAKSGTASAEITKKYADELGIGVDYYQDSPLMYQAVMNGTNPACFEDRNVIGWAIKKDGLALKTVGDIENSSEYAMAVKKGSNAELLAMFNAGLANIKASGEYDIILKKYGFEDTEFKNPGAARLESGVVPEKNYIIYSDNSFAPFVFLDTETKAYTGIDMELIAAIAKDQGFEYEMHNDGFEIAVNAVKNGQADAVIAGMSAEEGRKNDFDFSDGYFEDGQIMVVPLSSNLTSIKELSNKQ